MIVNELRIEELMIGNLVLFHQEIDTIIELGQSNNGFCKINGYFNFDKLTIMPIQLTEEWLIKFGFKFEGGAGFKAPHNTEYWHFTLRNGFMPNTIARGGINSDQYKGAKYVHQLQNLYFALTGNELKLES